MSILSFFKKAEKEKLFVLDIGTEAVKALVFSYSPQKDNKENNISVLDYAVEYFDEFSVWDSSNFSHDVIKRAISKVLHIFKEEAWQKLNLFVSLPGNLFKSRVIFQKIVRKNPKENISKSENQMILNGVLETAKKESAGIFSSKTGILPQDLKFVGLKILEIKIDGYEVPVLEGYAGEKLEFRILTQFLFKSYLDNFEKIMKQLHLNPQKIVHQSLTIAEIPPFPNAILFDVGGDITQIFIIRNGKMEIADEIEFGAKIFNQRLSDVLGMDQGETRYFKETYSQNLFSEGVRGKTKEILSGVAEDWMSAVKSKISDLKILIPSNIFIYGGGSLIPEIGEALENNFQGSQITFLSLEYLKNIEFENHIKLSADAQGMNALLIAAQKLNNFN
ncbi:MAG: hypothetical protein Q7T34_01850 [Candidatus Parcubacteria bacterium]|nr:hypothetical protein [Candidatus Parcubacteria bacterium]